MSERFRLALGALRAVAAVVLVAGAVQAQPVIKLPLADRYVEADFPEAYRIGDGIREWELLSRVASLGFDADAYLHIGDLAGEELQVLIVDPRGDLVVRCPQLSGLTGWSPTSKLTPWMSRTW